MFRTIVAVQFDSDGVISHRCILWSIEGGNMRCERVFSIFWITLLSGVFVLVTTQANAATFNLTLKNTGNFADFGVTDGDRFMGTINVDSFDAQPNTNYEIMSFSITVSDGFGGMVTFDQENAPFVNVIGADRVGGQIRTDGSGAPILIVPGIPDAGINPNAVRTAIPAPFRVGETSYSLAFNFPIDGGFSLAQSTVGSDNRLSDPVLYGVGRYHISPTPIPLPPAFLAFLSAMAGLFVIRRMQRARAV